MYVWNMNIEHIQLTEIWLAQQSFQSELRLGTHLSNLVLAAIYTCKPTYTNKFDKQEEQNMLCAT